MSDTKQLYFKHFLKMIFLCKIEQKKKKQNWIHRKIKAFHV